MAPCSLRPSELLRAFFAAGLCFMLAAALAAIAYELSGRDWLAANMLASLRGAIRPLALPPRLIALAQAFLAVGLLVALAATISTGVAGPFSGSSGAALAVLLLVGWIGLTVSGSLLHLLAILARVKSFTFPMPRPRPTLDRALTATAGVGVAALTLSHTPGLRPLGDPAAALAVAVAGVLAFRVLTLALRVLRPAPS